MSSWFFLFVFRGKSVCSTHQAFKRVFTSHKGQNCVLSVEKTNCRKRRQKFSNACAVPCWILTLILYLTHVFCRWRPFFQQCAILWKWGHAPYLWSAVLLCCGLGLPGFCFSILPHIPATRGNSKGVFWASSNAEVSEMWVFIFLTECMNIHLQQAFGECLEYD